MRKNKTYKWEWRQVNDAELQKKMGEKRKKENREKDKRKKEENVKEKGRKMKI